MTLSLLLVLLLLFLLVATWLYFGHSTTHHRRVVAAWMFAFVAVLGWPNPWAALGVGLWVSRALDLAIGGPP